MGCSSGLGNYFGDEAAGHPSAADDQGLDPGADETVLVRRCQELRRACCVLACCLRGHSGMGVGHSGLVATARGGGVSVRS